MPACEAGRAIERSCMQLDATWHGSARGAAPAASRRNMQRLLTPACCQSYLQAFHPLAVQHFSYQAMQDHTSRCALGLLLQLAPPPLHAHPAMPKLQRRSSRVC